MARQARASGDQQGRRPQSDHQQRLCRRGGADRPYPARIWQYPLTPDQLAELYAVDLEGARALMEEAGLADGFSVELQAISAPRDYTQIAEIVRENCAQLNIDVTVQPLEIGQFAENVGNGSYEWCSTGRGMRGDPAHFVIDFRSGTNLNVIWFGNAGAESSPVPAGQYGGLAER